MLSIVLPYGLADMLGIQYDIMVKEVARSRIEQHEEVCALRYKNIEARLEAGSQRFNRLESMIVGLYILIIGSQILGAVL